MMSNTRDRVRELRLEIEQLRLEISTVKRERQDLEDTLDEIIQDLEDTLDEIVDVLIPYCEPLDHDLPLVSRLEMVLTRMEKQQ
jgi:chromosome segregation ATPase